jgi:hypothetical protein
MQERRKQPRSRTYFGGQVVYDQRYCATDCLIRNLSQDGARLVFAGPAIIPMEFDLVIRQRGHSRRVQLVWRKEADVGVKFLHRHAETSIEASIAIEAAQKISALKAQNSTLVRRVSELSESTI